MGYSEVPHNTDVSVEPSLFMTLSGCTENLEGCALLLTLVQFMLSTPVLTLIGFSFSNDLRKELEPWEMKSRPTRLC